MAVPLAVDVRDSTAGSMGQEVKSANTVAEEWIQVSSSSATVLQWFEWIEKVRESYCHIIRHRWNWGMYAG